MRKFFEFGNQFLLILLVGITGVQISLILGFYYITWLMILCLFVVCIAAMFEYMEKTKR